MRGRESSASERKLVVRVARDHSLKLMIVALAQE